MGAAPSASPAHPAATIAVCGAIERVVASQHEYARELHDFAVQRMESDAALAMSDVSSSSSTRSRLAITRSSALNKSMQDRLLADFLVPTSKHHQDMIAEIQQPSEIQGVHPRNQVPLDSSKTLALAPPSPATHSSPPMQHPTFTASPEIPPAALSPGTLFSSLSPAEQEKAIRAGVEAEVARVWNALEMQKHYDAMSVKQSFAQKEEALQQALVQTFDELEF